MSLRPAFVTVTFKPHIKRSAFNQTAEQVLPVGRRMEWDGAKYF